jgi:rod shape-determining protein MreD
MGKEFRIFLLTVFLLVVAVLLQSTILNRVAIATVKPDLALIILVFVSLRRGSMIGQTSGFFSGILEDFMSAAPFGFYPLGFHPLMRAVIGYLYGLLSGKVFVDPFMMPMVLTAVATLIKGVVAGLLSTVFGFSSSGFLYFTGRLWIEVGYNAVLSPFIFALLGLFRIFKQAEKEGF